MPKLQDVKKIMVIGSGPIIIGQAAEFDYAGTQACRALKEEGFEVVLVNSNPATIMTDSNIADRVYIEALNAEFVEKIIAKERPDGLLATLGGQTGLNLCTELFEKGILQKYNVRLLGTSIESIQRAEDRELFKEAMEKINIPIIESDIVEDVESAVAFANQIGYPVIVRPAFTLGGTGGGMADNEEELRTIAADGIRASRVNQVLIEKSVAGWKEIEYETIRDSKGNAIIVCNMENIDPLGIHTGDSIVVAPTQTLRYKEHHMLKDASLRIIEELKIEGGCNVQFALDTDSMNYYIIEVNPRVSRSSALASKATGYPIAKVSTKIAVGYTLDEIRNDVTGVTFAGFEPTIDYVVAKVPRWPFDKFVYADKRLGTRMKATGEVMSMGSNVEEALLKAIRSLEIGMDSFDHARLSAHSNEEIERMLQDKTDDRLFIVSEALRRGYSVEYVNRITRIDHFFLNKIKNVVEQEEALKKLPVEDLNAEMLLSVKKLGISDKAIARFMGLKEDQIRGLREFYGILPTYKMVDTCAAEFDAVSPYYYSTYQTENEVEVSDRKKIVVLGSGPIRIGQGVEFDYCSVHAIWALQKMGYETIIINNNPETVSTDFNIADKLYFDPLTPEDVLNVLRLEKPDGVVVQFGGQTAIKLAESVEKAGYRIMGTSNQDIERAEDRELFDELLSGLGVKRPEGHTVFTGREAVEAANSLGYPVLVRPSFVLGGQGMEIAYSDKDILEYMSIINRSEQEHPILVDKYIVGKELETDALSDGEDVLIPGVMEHIERTGIHSGDSISVYPPQSISPKAKQTIVDLTIQLAKALNVKGMINIQFIAQGDDIYIIEVNPRSSRTVPYISKVTGLPVIELATRAAMGEKLKDMGCPLGLAEEREYVAVKVPVFSFEKLPGLEVSLGPEMKSTGEVLGIGKSLTESLYKGFTAAGYDIETSGDMLITVSNHDKQEMLGIAKDFVEAGLHIYSTEGTAAFFKENGIENVDVIHKIGTGKEPNIETYIKQGRFRYIVNTPTRGRTPERDGFKIRRFAVENGVPCITTLDTAKVVAECCKLKQSEVLVDTYCLKDLEI